MAINPYVPATSTGNGVQVDFTFTFPYISPTHVKVTLNGVPTTAFTFLSSNILRFTVPPGLGVVVVITRETPGDEISNVIQPGGPLPVNGINQNFRQSLYYNQETEYASANQSTAGLQAQITAATNTANSASANAGAAVTTANAAQTTANGIAGTASAAVTTANAAQATATAAQTTANAALPNTGGTMTGVITYAAAQPRLVVGTAVASTSGTSIDFTDIPSWVKRIMVIFDQVSTNGTSVLQVQLGDSGGVETTGYLSTGGFVATAGGVSTVSSGGYSSGFAIFAAGATQTRDGIMTIANISGDKWVASHSMSTIDGGTAVSLLGGGRKELLSTLDRVRITTVGGTDTFDSGLINISYEG